MMAGRRHYARQSGYVLILNICVLALLMLGATYMGRRMDAAVSMVRAERERLDQDEQIAAARAEVMFMLATTPRTRFGLGVDPRAVVPDGRLYRVGDNAAVAFQDVRGLISLNGIGLSGSGREPLERLLGTYGLDAEASGRLVDALLDYRDADSLRRLNGAEREDYSAAGRQADLRNNDLKVPNELARVYGWSDVDALWGDDPITGYVSVHVRPVLNPNTANWRVLMALSGLSKEAVQALLVSRQRGEIQDVTPLVAPGVSSDPFSGGPAVVKAPSDELIVTFYARGGRSGLRLDVLHSPESAYAPWKIRYAERVPAPAQLKGWEDLPRLPAAASLAEWQRANAVQLPF